MAQRRIHRLAKKISSTASSANLLTSRRLVRCSLISPRTKLRLQSFKRITVSVGLPQKSHLARTGKVFWFVLFRVFSGSLLLSRRTRRATKHTKQHETRDH